MCPKPFDHDQTAPVIDPGSQAKLVPFEIEADQITDYDCAPKRKAHIGEVTPISALYDEPVTRIGKEPTGLMNRGEIVFTGTRVPARTLVDYLKSGHTLEDFLDGFPSVNRSQAVASLEMTLEAADLARVAP